MDLTVAGLWATMGVFARGIVIVLLIMSISSLGVLVERIFHYRKTSGASLAFAAKLSQLAGNDFGAAVDYGSSVAKSADAGFLGKVVGSGLAAYKSAVGREHEVVIESAARAIERSSARELSVLKRGLGLLATVGSVAPFVGLLGTVMGIIDTFQQMKGGSANLATVGPGISEALVTTALGLVVAIPAVMGFNYLNGRVEGFTVDMQESGNEVVDLVAKNVERKTA